jgi:hypothetical protein
MIQIPQVTVNQLICVAAVYHAKQFTDYYGRPTAPTNGAPTVLPASFVRPH